MIYTSYFAKLSKLPPNITPIAICGKSPEWYKGFEYKKLAPKWSFFSEWKKTHDHDFYIKHFNNEVLAPINASRVVEELYMLIEKNQDEDIVLICYEKPTDFCHRHLVADWLTQNGYPVNEYQFN